MAELADAPDLGSGVPDVQVQVLLSALYGAESNRRGSDFAPFCALNAAKQNPVGSGFVLFCVVCGAISNHSGLSFAPLCA